jgi:hypothetical protein
MFIDFVAKAKTAPRQAPVAADAPLMRACCFDPATGTLQQPLNCRMPIPSHNPPPPPLQTLFPFAKSRFLNPALSTCVTCAAFPFQQ